MDTELILACQEEMPKANELIANGFSYERMKDAPKYIDGVLRSAFDTLRPIGFNYLGYEILPLYDSVMAMSRTCKKSSKRALEIMHTSSFPVCCKLEFTEKSTGLKTVFRKNCQITFFEKGNVFTNVGSKYIGSPKLGDPVFSLDRESIFVSISRSRMVFIRTAYFYVEDGQVVSTDIHRAKLYYDSVKDTQSTKTAPAPETIPTLVNYILCEYGLQGSYKHFYGTDVQVFHEADFDEDKFSTDEYVICRSNGRQKGRNLMRSSIVLVIPTKQYTLELRHVIAATFFILDSNVDNNFFSLSNLNNPTSWKRALADVAITEDNEMAAIDKVESHIESVKSYIDYATKQNFKREGLDIDDIFGLFKYIICNFPMIASTVNVASMENKVLSIVPHFLFNLTSSIFRMMFELQKEAAKKHLSSQQVKKLLQSKWREEASLYRITSLDNVRSLEHAPDCMLPKATRLIVPQAKRGPGAKQMAEMSNPAFFFHPSLVGIISYQYMSKSAPTAIDSLNPMVRLLPGDVVAPHEAAIPIKENVEELTTSESTLKGK